MRKIFSLLLSSLFSTFVFANNIQISNVAVNGNNITFTLSWENSWNTTNNTLPEYPNNWDAVWIFVKYQSGVNNLWTHVVLSATSANHSVTGAGGVLQVNAVTDGIGVFVRRSSPGGGNISGATVTLAMTGLPAGPLNFKVFGIEMVHCPTGSFQIGDGNGGPLGNPINFRNQIIDATVQSNGIPGSGLYNSISTFEFSPDVPNTFPMGYNGFYIMKYEASHEQYADFLNTLTYTQQERRTNTAPNSSIGTKAIANSGTGFIFGTTGIIEIITPGTNNILPAVYGCDFTDDNNFNNINDGQNIALEGVGTADWLAYLDWSGLRPMTEMEFEKACRGTRPAVIHEYAWGSTEISCRQRVIVSQGITFQQLTNWGEAGEGAPGTAVNGMCFCGVGITIDNPGDGTARNGIFASSATGRKTSGAGFYGAMDLSGSVHEFCIKVDNTYLILGSSPFNGTHGNGLLNSNGDADVSNWPGENFGPSNLNGIGIKGGSWQDSSTDIFKVSYRFNGILSVNTNRNRSLGIRGVRTYY